MAAMGHGSIGFVIFHGVFFHFVVEWLPFCIMTYHQASIWTTSSQYLTVLHLTRSELSTCMEMEFVNDAFLLFT